MAKKSYGSEEHGFDEAFKNPEQSPEQLGSERFEKAEKVRVSSSSLDGENKGNKSSQKKNESQGSKKYEVDKNFEEVKVNRCLDKSESLPGKSEGSCDNQSKEDGDLDIGIEHKSFRENEGKSKENKGRGRKSSAIVNKKDIDKHSKKASGKTSHNESKDAKCSSSQKISNKNYDRGKPNEKKSAQKKLSDEKTSNQEVVRLNKFLANAGICSRREADKLIEAGAVTVNGKVITELGFKVKPGDRVVYGGQRIKAERKVYLLLNKPKDCLTTTYDPRGRRTVMDLIKGACKERVYPVGRLDRNTTGVLLLTNDGDLSKKLLHPKHRVPKIYHVTLDKNISKKDMFTLFEGVELEDGFVKVDNIAYVSTAKSKKEVGIEIHSGKNRVVRRMFEHLGYKVVKLDRVSFAGLTKKDLPRGRYRFLSEKEVNFLKMIS